MFLNPVTWAEVRCEHFVGGFIIAAVETEVLWAVYWDVEIWWDFISDTTQLRRYIYGRWNGQTSPAVTHLYFFKEQMDLKLQAEINKLQNKSH